MDLEDYISPERLKIYVDILKLKPDEAMGAYNWNKALCGAMQPLMHCLEITFRNAIDHGIRHNPPPGAVGLWRTDANWIFDLPRYVGDKTYIRQGKRFKTDTLGNVIYRNRMPVYNRTVWEEDCIRKVSTRIKTAGKTATAERVISGLDFGFWTNFLSKTYEETRNFSLLWPQLKEDIFPGTPKTTARHKIDKKFSRIRELRNRLAHHEAIWKFQKEDAITGKPDYSQPIYGLAASLHLLRRAWDDILEALYWISPTRHAAFLAEGHHVRFCSLATEFGLFSFIDRTKLPGLNVRGSQEVRLLLRGLRQQKIISLTDRGRIVAVIGPDLQRF
ncbi:CAAX protease [Yersinia enterocolitica]|uniref:Abi family protein n=1 Tax=Yersinia enterocolitica TaxID=630 RepID=UPI003D010DD5